MILDGVLDKKGLNRKFRFKEFRLTDEKFGRKNSKFIEVNKFRKSPEKKFNIKSCDHIETIQLKIILI